MVSSGQPTTAIGGTDDDPNTIELVETVQVASSATRTAAARRRCRPLARVLRIRVFQIFCGIGCMIMAAVAFIEEKRFNLAVGLLSGALTVMAASVSIQNSSCFDKVYHSWNVNEFSRPPRLQLPAIFTKIARPTLGVTLTWLVAGVGNTVLIVLTVITLSGAHVSDTLLALCVLEMLLVTGLLASAAAVVLIDCQVLQEHAV